MIPFHIPIRIGYSIFLPPRSLNFSIKLLRKNLGGLQCVKNFRPWNLITLDQLFLFPLVNNQLVVVGSTSLSTNQMVLWSDIKLVSWLRDTPNVRLLIFFRLFLQLLSSYLSKYCLLLLPAKVGTLLSWMSTMLFSMMIYSKKSTWIFPLDIIFLLHTVHLLSSLSVSFTSRFMAYDKLLDNGTPSSLRLSLTPVLSSLNPIIPYSQRAMAPLLSLCWFMLTTSSLWDHLPLQSSTSKLIFRANSNSRIWGILSISLGLR